MVYREGKGVMINTITSLINGDNELSCIAHIEDDLGIRIEINLGGASFSFVMKNGTVEDAVTFAKVWSKLQLEDMD